MVTDSGERMTDPPDDPADGPRATFRHMRKLAERRARERAEGTAQRTHEQFADFDQLVHELSVHQIELQLQNEQLQLTQRELEASRDHYRDLFENAPVGYVLMGFDGVMRHANRNVCALLGAAESQLIGRRLIEFVLNEDRPRTPEAMRKATEEDAKVE